MIKNNRNAMVVAGPPWQDRTARWLALGIIRAQSSVARRLHEWEQKLNRPEKKVLLFLFCLLAGGYCLCLLGGALYGKIPAHASFYPSGHLTLTVPLPPNGPGIPYTDTLPYRLQSAPTMNPQKRP